MSKRKRKRQSRLPLSMAERRLRSIVAVLEDPSSDTDAINEAYHELLHMENRYVLPPEYYSSRMIAASKLKKNPGEVLETAEAGVTRYPRDVSLRFNLGVAYYQSEYPLLAYREFRLAREGHTRDDAQYLSVEQIDELIQGIESEAQDLLSPLGLQWPADEEIAVAGERVRRLLEGGDPERSVQLARETLEHRPDQNHMRNNLARALWQMGEIDQAIEEQEESLRNAPDRLNGLANMVRFCTITGRTSDARKWADHALTLDPPEGPNLFSLIEILAFLDEGSRICSLAKKYRHAMKGWPEWFRGITALLIGVACARTGRVKDARKWWSTARSTGLAQEVQLRSDALNRSANDGSEVWYFSAPDLLPREVARMLGSMDFREESDDFASWLRPTLEAFPQFSVFGPYLIRHGDDLGRAIGLALLEITKDDEMAKEAAKLIRNDKVPEYLRDHAMHALESSGPVDVPELDEILYVQGYRISLEPTESLPEAAKELFIPAHDHLLNDRPDQAEQLLLKALKRCDHPSIRQNLAVAYQNQGKDAEVNRLLKETRTKYPDYAFARLAEATKLAGQRKFEEAHNLIQPVIQRQNFHVSEFTALCETMCSILIQEEKLDEAFTWLEMWRTIKPDDSSQKKYSYLDAYHNLGKFMKKTRKKRNRR